jgi:hypothetical protein
MFLPSHAAKAESKRKEHFSTNTSLQNFDKSIWFEPLSMEVECLFSFAFTCAEIGASMKVYRMVVADASKQSIAPKQSKAVSSSPLALVLIRLSTSD